MTSDQIYDALQHARLQCLHLAQTIPPKDATTGAGELLMFGSVLFAALASGVKKATSDE